MPRINHNIPAMITGNALNSATAQMQTSLERLSTGLRINRAADDAAGLSISQQLTTQVNGLNMGLRNAQDGVALVNIADGALTEVEAMIQRMRELSIQSSNDTLTSLERSYCEVEFDQLRGEIDRIVAGTQYNSMNLLNGQGPWGTTGGVLHIGPNNVTTNDVVMVTIAGVNTTSLGISSAPVDNVFITSQSEASNSIDSLDIALSSVNTLRAYLGGVTNRLEHAITNQQNQTQNMQAAESTITDTDFASETTEYTRDQILVQSSTAMLAQANSLPQNILSLLKG
jgi:flagellin